MVDPMTERDRNGRCGVIERLSATCLAVVLLAILFVSNPALGLPQQVIEGSRISHQTPNFGSLDPGDRFGESVATIGFLDADQNLDIVVGAPYDDDVAMNAGAIYILFLGPAEFGRQVENTVKITLPGISVANSRFGASVTSLGDYDNDGNFELAVSEYGSGDTGRVFLLDVDSTGALMGTIEISADPVFAGVIGAGDFFGQKLSVIDDVNGDGVVDLAIGHQKDDDGLNDAGAVWITFLAPDGSGVTGTQKISNLAGGFAAAGGSIPTGGFFGTEIDSLGDLDSDGVPEIVVGASKAGAAGGAIYLLFLDSAGMVKSIVSYDNTDPLLTLPSGTRFGFGLGSIGHPMSNLGWRTLAVGTPQIELNGRGEVYLVELDPSQQIVDVEVFGRDVTGFPMALGDWFGWSVTPIGDANADGFGDLLVGYPFRPSNGADAGGVEIMPLGGPKATDRVCLPSNESGDGLKFEFIGGSVGSFVGVETKFETHTPQVDVAPEINLDLEDQSSGSFGPFLYVGAGFSARFSGYLNIRVPGEYVFSGNSDDGLRLEIGDVRVIDKDRASFFTNTTRGVEFTEAGVYPFEVLYFDSAPCCNGVRVGAQGPTGSGLLAVDPLFDFDADLGPATTGGGPGTTVIPQDVFFQDLPSDCVPVVDTDFDTVSDYLDNCPDFYNPFQTDGDGDGVGDFCDNCKDVANPGQENTGGIPEEGDACAPAELRLVRDPVAVDPTFDLTLFCGGVSLGEINVGLRLPFGAVPSTADFGGGCDEPVVSPAPGVPAGLGCSANPDLGSNVDPADSGAYGPGLSPPFSSETVYLQLRGNGLDGRLCDAYETPSLFLGRFTTGPAATFSGASAFITSGLTANGIEKALDTNGNPANIGWNFRTSGPGDPDLEILLQPAAGEDEATATRWSLCIAGVTDQKMHRISAGIRVPGATTADIRVNGCDATPDGGGVRDCDADIPDVAVAATVDDGVSFTMGPFASPTAPLVNDTLYVVVEGSYNVPGAPTLNPTQFQEWCVATIDVAAPPGVAGVPPEFVTDGLDLLPYHDLMDMPPIPPDAWQTSSTLLVPLTLEQIAFNNGFNSGDDLDGDGVLDDADNCRFIANVDLSNNGDFLAIPDPPDDDGDACECGDANGSGAVFDGGTPDPSESPLTPDLDVIRAYLVGSNTDPAVAAICSVSDGIACDTKDAVVLQRAFNAQGPGVEPRCDAALPD